jgi:hypothetical protein
VRFHGQHLVSTLIIPGCVCSVQCEVAAYTANLIGVWVPGARAVRRAITAMGSGEEMLTAMVRRRRTMMRRMMTRTRETRTRRSRTTRTAEPYSNRHRKHNMSTSSPHHTEVMAG